VSVFRGKRRTEGSKFFCVPPWTGRTLSARSIALRHPLRSLSTSASPRSKPPMPASPIAKAGAGGDGAKARAGGDGAGSGGGRGLGAAVVRDSKNKLNVPMTKARTRGGRQHSVGSRRSGGGGSGGRGGRRRTEKESDEEQILKVLTYRGRILEMYQDTDC
jgi:hypothetical protein